MTGQIEPIVISQFLGLNRQNRFNAMAKEYAQAILNVDLSRETVRPRPSIAKTSFLDSVNAHVTTDPVRWETILHTLSGGKVAVWVQGDDIYTSDSPRILGIAAATGTQQDSALTRLTYPQKFRSPTTVYFLQEINGSVFICNGQDAPLRWSPETGLIRWGIYQPRTLNWFAGLGPVLGTGNQVFQGGTNDPEPLGYGNKKYAFAWHNAKTGETSNPSPIFDYADAGSPFTATGGIGQILFGLERPTDSQVTHAIFYATMTGGTVNDLKQFGPPIEVPAAGRIILNVLLTTTGHRELYSDLGIRDMPPLEFDHHVPPPLAGLIEHRNYLEGFVNWEERFLPGRTSVHAGAASATTGAGYGYCVQIVPSVANPEFRVHEGLTRGFTIEFPNRSGRPHPIMDVIESTQMILIGQTIQDAQGGSGLVPYFDQLDAVDQARVGEPFIIRAPNFNQHWSKRNQPGYWPGSHTRPIGRQDGEGIKSMWVTNDTVMIAKSNRLYSNQYDSSPAVGDGRVRLLSSNVGCPSPHGFAHGDGFTEFQHYSGIFMTDGGTPVKISKMLGNQRMTPGLFSVHDRVTRAILHFISSGYSGPGSDLDVGGAFVHYYERGAWSVWGWAGRTFTCGMAAVDSDDLERVYLATSDGYHYIMHDSIDGVGAADGHASLQDSLFFPRSFATAPAAVGTVTDTNNRFPNQTLFGASVIGDPIRVISGKGAGQTGTISARVSDTEITVSGFTVALDETSEYEIGYIREVYRLPWMRFGHVAHKIAQAHLFFVPRTFGTIGDRFSNDKRLEVRVVEGFPASSATAFSNKLIDRYHEKDGDATTGVPMVAFDPINDRALVDYTNAVVPARVRPNRGHAHVEFPATGMWTQFEVGETGAKIKGEIIEICLNASLMEERAR